MNTSFPVPVHLLEALLIFSRASSMVEAAKFLGITQSAFSKQLALLEEMLPQKVFSFSGRKKILTHYGSKLCQRLDRRLSGLHEEIRQINMQFSKPTEAELVVAARSEIVDRFLCQWDFPGKLEFVSASSTEIQDGLKKRKFDLGILQNIPDSHELMAKPIFSDQFVLIVPGKYRITEENISKRIVDYLRDKPVLIYSGYGSRCENLFTHFGFKEGTRLQIHRICDQWSGVVNMVEKGFGWSLVPDSFVANIKSSRTLNLPDALKNKTTFYAVFSRELNQVSWFRDFIAATVKDKKK